jgi:hypothetical protein
VAGGDRRCVDRRYLGSSLAVLIATAAERTTLSTALVLLVAGAGSACCSPDAVARATAETGATTQ